MPPLIEVRPANERGVSISWSPNSFAEAPSPISLQSITTCCAPTPDHSTKVSADAAVMAGADGVEHARIGNGRGIAFALQLEFRVVDAARHVGGEHQQQIDVVGGARRCRRQYAAGENQDDEDFDYAHRRTHRRASTVNDGENATAASLYQVCGFCCRCAVNPRRCGPAGMRSRSAFRRSARF